MRRATAVLLWLLLAAAPAPGQALRLTTHEADNVTPTAIFAAQDGAWYLLGTGFEFCQDLEHVTRVTDLQGAFLGPDNPTDCRAKWDLMAIGVQSSGIMLFANVVSTGELHGWLFDSLGTRQTAEVVIGAQHPSYVGQTTVLAHPNGTFIVVWDGKIDAAHFSSFGRVVNQDGTFVTGEVRLPQAPAGGSHGGTRAALLGNGDVVAVWAEGIAPARSRIDARIFSPELIPLTGDITLWGSVMDMSLALAAAGDDYVVGLDIQAPPRSIIQRFNRYSGPVSKEIDVDDGSPDQTSLAGLGMDAAGNTIVSWYDDDTLEEFVSRYDPAMNKRGPAFRVNLPPLRGCCSELAVWPSGDFVVASDAPIDTYGWGTALSRRYFFPVSILAAPGPGAANPATVRAVTPDGQDGYQPIAPYGVPGYGANVAAGDIDGDRVSEALTGPGPGPLFGPQVRGFEASGPPLSRVNFYAYGTLRFGVRPGAGDIDGDGYAEILAAPGPGEVFGPHVRGFDFDGKSVTPIPGVSFFAYGTPRFGARTGAGEIDGDAYAEILTAPGPGAIFRPHIRGFELAGGQVQPVAGVSFFARGGSYGATVAAADIESDGNGVYGDGYQEIVTGAGPDPAWSGELAVYDYDGVKVTLKLTATAYTTSYGTVVAGGDIDAGDTEEVVASPGPDPAAVPHLRCYEWTPNIGEDRNGPYFDLLGPDDVDLWPGLGYGASVAVGSF